MRISELSELSGVPVPTVKYYLREGLLHPGEALNARESSYNPTHVTRLRLVRGLVHVLGTSIEQVRRIIEIIDGPGLTAVEAMGQATIAVASSQQTLHAVPKSEVSVSLAQEVLDEFGYRYEEDSPYVRQLNVALTLADEAGITLNKEHLHIYANAAREIAKADFDRIPWQDKKAAVQFAVLGTALYEPVLLALRHLAHYEQGLALLDNDPTQQQEDQ